MTTPHARDQIPHPHCSPAYTIAPTGMLCPITLLISQNVGTDAGGGEGVAEQVPLFCGGEGSIGLPNSNPTGTVYRRDSLCICPLRSKCVGSGCISTKTHVYQKKPRQDTPELIGFVTKNCPKCKCVRTVGLFTLMLRLRGGDPQNIVY